VNRTEALLTRLAIIVIGYVAASFLACAFMLLILLTARLSFGSLSSFVALALGGTLFSTYFTAIPSAAAVLFFEIFDVRSKWLYLIGGGVIAAVALVLSIGHDFRTFVAQDTLILIGAVIGGGCIGGLVFWRLVGQRAGSWRLQGHSSCTAASSGSALGESAGE
jgi:hypothetical protein